MSEEIKSTEINLEQPEQVAAPAVTDTTSAAAAPAPTPAPAREYRERQDYPRRRRPDGPPRGEGSEDGRQDQGQRTPRFRKKVCRFCLDKNIAIDYKKVDLLERFITDRGKILPRRVTGTCSRHQRGIARAIKRARIIALLPFVEQ